MANEEDLARIQQGPAVWNDWRAQNPKSRANLAGANLARADLAGANLYKANLYKAHLIGVHLGRANLGRADLAGTNLTGVDLAEADLGEANLAGADLFETMFVNVDLSATKGLDTCRHLGPSVLDHRTLQRSGRLPLVFLRGCGLPDRLIDYLPSLLEEAIQYYSCFISYSSKDDAFANRLYADLQNKGVRCWFAPEDMKIGDKFRRRIDEAIHVHERLLLILSENSVSSEWVEKEVETAFEKEQRQKRTVLFPARLDDAVMKCETGWSADIRRSRHIGDFRRWKDYDAYQQVFNGPEGGARVISSLDPPGKRKRTIACWVTTHLPSIRTPPSTPSANISRMRRGE